MNPLAIFSDETENYVIPVEPEPNRNVKLRIRTPRNEINSVEYIDADTDMASIMYYVTSDTYFSYYQLEIRIGEKPLKYYYRIRSGANIYYCNRLGTADKVDKKYSFCIIPGFHTPAWAKGTIMYQIFVDRFCRGDSTNDVVDDEYIYIGLPVRHIIDWNENPSPFDVGYFYGGDITGVSSKLDYIKRLGVDVIYFNPLFVSPSNHKYDTQDYEHIDPHIGKIVKDQGDIINEDAIDNTNATKYICRSADIENLNASDAFFAKFMQEIHKRGMKVIIDGVFNHCGSLNKWMDREGIYKKEGHYAPGAYQSADSPYCKYFQFADDRPEAWPNNKTYDGWWGNDTLPKLNYEESDELVEEIMKIAKKWLMPPYSVDGWRLDVAADLGHSEEFNHYFWKKFRTEVKSVNPEALILAEHYGNPEAWLNGKEWDTIMNYDAFMEPVSWFLTGLEKHSDRADATLRGNGHEFFKSMLYNKGKMPAQSYLTAMNELSNHDHSRFLTRTNHIVGRLNTKGSDKAQEGVCVAVLRQAALIQMTWPGAPTIYYGDEAGLCGWTDPDSRRPYPWGKEDLELVEYHEYLGNIRKSIDALKRGSLVPILGEQDLIVYGRELDRTRALVVIYTGKEEKRVDIPAWLLGINEYNAPKRIMYTNEDGYNVGRIEYAVQNGMMSLDLTNNTGLLFIAKTR